MKDSQIQFFSCIFSQNFLVFFLILKYVAILINQALSLKFCCNIELFRQGEQYFQSLTNVFLLKVKFLIERKLE